MLAFLVVCKLLLLLLFIAQKFISGIPSMSNSLNRALFKCLYSYVKLMPQGNATFVSVTAGRVPTYKESGLTHERKYQANISNQSVSNARFRDKIKC